MLTKRDAFKTLNVEESLEEVQETLEVHEVTPVPKEAISNRKGLIQIEIKKESSKKKNDIRPSRRELQRLGLSIKNKSRRAKFDAEKNQRKTSPKALTILSPPIERIFRKL